MDTLNAEARRICFYLRSRRWVPAEEIVNLQPELRKLVEKSLENCGMKLYVNYIQNVAIVENDPDLEVGNEEQMPGAVYDRPIKAVIVALFVYLVLPSMRKSLQTGSPISPRKIHQDTVYKLLPGLRRTEIDSALRILTKDGYLSGHEWPREAGPKLLAIPTEKLADELERSAYFLILKKELDKIEQEPE